MRAAVSITTNLINSLPKTGVVSEERRIQTMINAFSTLESAEASEKTRSVVGSIVRSCDRHAILQCQHEQDLVTHPLTEKIERFACQVGCTPLACAGILIEPPERVPVNGVDIRAAQSMDLDLGLCGSAFLA